MSQTKVHPKGVETENIEYKSTLHGKLPDDIWESITAFSNADGGTIIFGIDENGMKVGLPINTIDNLQRDVTTLCVSGFNHKLYPEISVEDNLIKAFIPPAPAVLRPIFSTSRGLPKGGRVRIGSSNVQLDDEWIRRFAIAAKGGAELVTFHGDFHEYFDQKTIDRYLRIVQDKRGNVYIDIPQEQLLTKLRALDSDRNITLFGLLAFSNEYGLQELTAPTVNVAVTQYSGTSKVNPEDIAQVSLDDKEFSGNVISQFENGLKTILSKLPVKSRIETTSGKRLDYLAIPEVAIRETLANAIVHRDYSTYKGRIQIDIYADRIEFANPGRSLVPLDQLETTHPETRNPLLMSYLRDLNITEHRGRGIRTIKNSLKAAGLAAPEFAHNHDWFVVTLYSSAFITTDDQTWLQQFQKYKLNERQLKALVHLKHTTGGVTNSEYRALNNMNNVRDDIRAKKDLAKLTSLGLLKKVGENRYRTYELTVS